MLSNDMPIKWKLRALLETHEFTVRDLAREITAQGRPTSEITLYRINGRSSKITPKGLDVLEDVLLGLESLTGQTFSPNDLLEVVRDAK
jgi:hypothetical protein